MTVPFVQRLITLCLVSVLCRLGHGHALKDDLQQVFDPQTALDSTGS